MPGRTIVRTTLLATALAGACLANAQKPKPTAKPAQKPAAQAPKPRVVLGTAQLPGDDGKLGTTYTMGERNKVNFTLTGAHFTKTRWNVGDNSYAPTREQKLLVLTFTVHNPNPEETAFNSGTLKFTAVDADDENHEGVGQTPRTGGEKSLAVDLKPAQKVECQTVIVVPAKGQVPKLMVAHQSGGGVLRYDLRPIVKGLEKPFSENGYDAAPGIPAEANAYYPLEYFDAQYNESEFRDGRFKDGTPGTNRVWLISKIRVKKASQTGHIMRFSAEAVDENGERYGDIGLMKATAEEFGDSTLEYGQERGARFVFPVAKGAHITKIRMWETQGYNSVALEFPVDLTAPGGATATTGSTTPANGSQADEYLTVFKKPNAEETAMEVTHTEFTEGNVKTSEIVVAGKRALLAEDTSTGAVTLSLPDTGETFRAPKAQGKEPQTSLAYYEMAYANSVAPKPKRRNPFADIAKSVLTSSAMSFGQQAVSGAVLSGFGQASLPQVINAGAQSTFQNYAVRELASQLGRAVMTSAQPTDGGPGHVHDTVTVDKKLYVESTLKGRKPMTPGGMKIDAASAKDVDAKTLYTKFADFMASGLPK